MCIMNCNFCCIYSFLFLQEHSGSIMENKDCSYSLAIIFQHVSFKLVYLWILSCSNILFFKLVFGAGSVTHLTGCLPSTAQFGSIPSTAWNRYGSLGLWAPHSGGREHGQSVQGHSHLQSKFQIHLSYKRHSLKIK